jgi:hypothetical protein
MSLHLLLTLLLALILLASCQSIRPEGQGYALTYGVHLGRDCFMMGNCGFRVEVDPGGTIRLLEDDGEWTLAAERRLSDDERAELAALLEDATLEGFQQPEDAPRGLRTVTIALSDGERQTHLEVVPEAGLPEAFEAFRERLETWLLAAARRGGA